MKMKMNYENFKAALYKDLSEKLEEEVELLMEAVKKQNGVLRDAITARFPNSPVSPVIYLDDAYEAYETGEMSYEKIVDIVTTSLMETKPKVQRIDRKTALENLFLTVMERNKNTALLENVPHENLEDLALVARCGVAITLPNGDVSQGSVLVNNEVLQLIEMTGEEALQVALANTNRQNVLCMPLEETVFGSSISGNMNIPKEFEDELTRKKNPSLWLLTNEELFGGAGLIASAPALQMAKNEIGGNFFILPSSVHELLLIPDNEDIDPTTMKEIVESVNETAVKPVEKLSDSIYYYDGDRVTRVA